jgi:hypothetical protein
LKQSMDNYSFRLDGSLIVPSHHVIIRSRILVPFTHAMGQQEKAEKGLFHAVISCTPNKTLVNACKKQIN